MEYGQKFLEGDEDIPEEDTKTHPEDKNRCWQALKYIKPRTNRTTPTFKGPNDEVGVKIYEKKVLVRAHIFLKPPAL